jgi:secondary thiamine-phosphate synthase enzyme
VVVELKVYNESFTFLTKGEVSFVDLTDMVHQAVSKSGLRNGLIHVFAPHATGIIVLTEYERGLLNDIREILNRLVPKESLYEHPDNAHSHLRSMLFSPCKTLPLVDGRPLLGTWQSIFFIETDTHPRHRRVVVQVIGE